MISLKFLGILIHLYVMVLKKEKNDFVQWKLYLSVFNLISKYVEYN